MFTESCIVCDKGLFWEYEGFQFNETTPYVLCKFCSKVAYRYPNIRVSKISNRYESLKQFFMVRYRILYEKPLALKKQFVLICSKCEKTGEFSFPTEPFDIYRLVSFIKKQGWLVNLIPHEDISRFPIIGKVFCSKCRPIIITRKKQIKNYIKGTSNG